jgi:hypothetical protein
MKLFIKKPLNRKPTYVNVIPEKHVSQLKIPLHWFSKTPKITSEYDQGKNLIFN